MAVSQVVPPAEGETAKPEGPFEIRLRSLGREETSLRLERKSFISELRRLVSSERGVLYWRTRLVFGTQVLDDDMASLCDLGIVCGSTVDMVITSPPPERLDALYARASGFLRKSDGYLAFQRCFSELTPLEKTDLFTAAVADHRRRTLCLK